ncbi:hypothetical protein C8R45DRAFT_1215433 [Mycena sanguinolenta]|nr:hypothetical protein C8R45DRAFT_1215433 [Mycena sanguinolenta]
MSVAQITVISSPELLEHTLVYLPMRDLLVTAPLVSKTWQAITLSPTLQQLLFFQRATSSGRAENPLLVELFPPFFAPGGGRANRWTCPNFQAIKAMPWSKAPDAFKRPEASWRRMLVTQPPAQRLVVRERCHGQIGDSVRQAVLDDPCLRMGVLYDLVLPLIDRIASSFLIHWPTREDVRDEIALDVVYTAQCSLNLHGSGHINKQFYSDAVDNISIKFGKENAYPDARPARRCAVSKTWHAITLTPTLQQLLFFQPDTSYGRAENPLLVEPFPPFFAPGGPNRWTWPNFEAIKTMPWSKAPDAFKRPEASWRRMLVTQHPAQRLVITERCHARRGDFMRRAVLDDPCLRMSVLYDLVLPFIHRIGSSFCIRWHADSDGKNAAGPNEITLAIIYTKNCCVDRKREIDKTFYSNAANTVSVEFGERVRVPWGDEVVFPSDS